MIPIHAATIGRSLRTLLLAIAVLALAFIPLQAGLLETGLPAFRWDERLSSSLLIPLLCLPLTLGILAATVQGELGHKSSFILAFVVLCNAFVPAAALEIRMALLSLAVQWHLLGRQRACHPVYLQELHLLGIPPGESFRRVLLPAVLRSLPLAWILSALFCMAAWGSQLARPDLLDARLPAALLLLLGFAGLRRQPRPQPQDPPPVRQHLQQLLLAALVAASLTILVVPVLTGLIPWYPQQILALVLTGIASLIAAALGALANPRAPLHLGLALCLCLAAGIGDYSVYGDWIPAESTQIWLVVRLAVAGWLLGHWHPHPLARSGLAALGALALGLASTPGGNLLAALALGLLSFWQPRLPMTGA